MPARIVARTVSTTGVDARTVSNTLLDAVVSGLMEAELMVAIRWKNGKERERDSRSRHGVNQAPEKRRRCAACRRPLEHGNPPDCMAIAQTGDFRMALETLMHLSFQA